MYIYQGKAIEMPPVIKNTKKIKVLLEDVLLTFVGSKEQGRKIIIEYAISYFNIPQSVNEYDIEAHIDKNSLIDVINKTIGELGKFVSIDYLSAKTVKFSFDVKAFLTEASFPTNIVNSYKYNQVELRLNKKVPEFVSQTSSDIIIPMFNRIMNTIVRNSPKYGKIITGLNRLNVSKSMILNTNYIPEKNAFNIEIKDPLRIIYYYNKSSLYNGRS